ncbi:MAG: hypothetical protein HC919_09090 [Oscillatoriales cyanobacterium SM2_2_1]|nr:hypothetical protein [Oscillatoriales cyanobacterium SM2_2_1]
MISALVMVLLWLGLAAAAQATLTDDHYDGNIFALYGGNGSLVPPRVTLTESLQLARPALLVFYADDSADCKRFTPVLNQMQGFYRRQLSIIPIAIDSLTPETEEGRFYRGFIPQTVLVNATGQQVLIKSVQCPWNPSMELCGRCWGYPMLTPSCGFAVAARSMKLIPSCHPPTLSPERYLATDLPWPSKSIV